MIKGHESYDLMRHSLADLFNSINKIIREGKVTIDECDIPVDILLGGDYKVPKHIAVVDNMLKIIWT